MNQRHAFVILAHGRLDLLGRLLTALQDPDFDIYLHMDASAEVSDEELRNLSDMYSNLTITERTSPYWGDVSLVDTELVCFKAVLDSGKIYSHIHLLSGQCFPVKSNSHIKEFFAAHPGEEFIQVADAEKVHYDHVRCWIPDTKYWKYKNGSKVRYRLNKIRNQAFYAYQKKVLHWQDKPARDRIVFRKAPQWISITPEFATLLVSKREFYASFYKHNLAPDEFFAATEAWNSDTFRGKINDTRTRYICWENDHTPHPLDITVDNVHEAVESDCLFSRKFDSVEAMDKAAELIISSSK